MSTNYMKLTIPAKSCNEQFARCTVAAFASILDPDLETINDIKTSVSEAVTNCIVHAYQDNDGAIEISASIDKQCITVTVTDQRNTPCTYRS